MLARPPALSNGAEMTRLAEPGRRTILASQSLDPPTKSNGAEFGVLQTLPWESEILNWRRLSVAFPVDWRIAISREPLGADAMDHSSPFMSPFETFQCSPKSSENMAWLRIDVLAPEMCRLSGELPVA